MWNEAALTLALVALLPVVAVVLWRDLRDMIIPNGAVLAVALIFLATGSWGLPLDVFLWRIGAGLGLLIAGILVFAATSGAIGGGDLKLIAAAAPFVGGPGAGRALTLFAALSLLGVAAQRLARSRVAGRSTGWAALDQGARFPLGVSLGLALLAHLAIELALAR